MRDRESPFQARWIIDITFLEHIKYLLDLSTSLKYEINENKKFEKSESDSDTFYLYHDENPDEVIRSNNITLKYYSVDQVKPLILFVLKSHCHDICSILIQYQIYEWIGHVHAAYPEITEIINIGKTYLDKQLLVLKVSIQT